MPQWSRPVAIPNQTSKTTSALTLIQGQLHLIHLGESSDNLWHSVWNIVSSTGRAFEPMVFLTMTSGVMLLAILIVVIWGPVRLAPPPRPAPPA